MTATQDWEMANQSKSSSSLEEKQIQWIVFSPFLSSFTALHVGPQEKFLLPFQKREKPTKYRAISIRHHLPQAKDGKHSTP